VTVLSGKRSCNSFRLKFEHAAHGTNSLITQEISTTTFSDSRKYNGATSLELQKVFVTRIYRSIQAQKLLEAQFTEVLYTTLYTVFIGVE